MLICSAFVRWIVVLICGSLVMGNRYEIYLDSCIHDNWEYVNVDMVDDVNGYVCIGIGWEGGDEAMCVDKICFLVGKNYRRHVNPEVYR